MDDPVNALHGQSEQHKLNENAVYVAAKAHAARRGIDLTEWPNQQAFVPDECRWMREAIRLYLSVAADGHLE